MNKIYLTSIEAKPLIKECDVLFVSGIEWFSPLVKWWTKSQYSHVALASWANTNLLEIIEFHAARGGGATINYNSYFPKYTGNVDVYRPDIQYEDRVFNTITKDVDTHFIPLDQKAITNDMRALTGIPYGYRRLLKMFTELFSTSAEDLTSDNRCDIIYPVCSTAVAYCFEKNGFLLLRHRNYEWMTPGDLAMSPTLNYLFTIT